MSEYEISKEVLEVVKKVIKDFPDRFAIKEQDIACLKEVRGFMKHAATIRRVPPIYRILSGYSLCLIVKGKGWSSHEDLDYKYALIFHELSHVLKEGDTYRLQDHDIEDFIVLIKAIGPRWENKRNVKDKIKKVLEEMETEKR